MKHAYWGEEFNDAQISEFLTSQNTKHEHVKDEDQLISRTVDALKWKKVIGWQQGPFEFGPRALGARSILADPRTAEVKDIVNTKIKSREPYQPSAPSILAEAADDYFDVPGISSQESAKLMSLVAPVKKAKQDKILAASHIGTGRLQTVFQETNARYYKLLKAFGQATGVPVLMKDKIHVTALASNVR
jgi:carbamoyltransferase